MSSLPEDHETSLDETANADEKKGEEPSVEEAIEKLIEKWGETRPCPYCGNTSWVVDLPVRLLHDVDDGMGLSPSIYPVSCDNCGNTVLLSVDKLLGPGVAQQQLDVGDGS